MSYLTLTENLKLQISPGLVASYDIQPGNRVGHIIIIIIIIITAFV